MIQIDLLGPFDARRDDFPLAIPRMRERALLARLALTTGEVSTVARLVDDLWGDKAPQNALGALQTMIYRVRRALGAESDSLVHRSGGYGLMVERDRVDALRFERLIRSAVQRNRNSNVAQYSVNMLEAALSMWRGEPLSGLEKCPFVSAQVTRLIELRATALMDRFQADLDAGRHREISAEIEGFVAEEPLRERAWGLLMLAHYRNGSQAAALQTYDRLRRTLDEDMGIDPNPELQRLQHLILTQDSRLEGPRDRTPSTHLPGLFRRMENTPEPLPETSSVVAVLIAVPGEPYRFFDSPAAALNAALADRAAACSRGARVDQMPPTVLDVTVSPDADPTRNLVQQLDTLVELAQPGQLLVSGAAAESLRERLPRGVALVDLGYRTSTSIFRPRRLFEVACEVARSYNGVRSGRRVPGSLPAQYEQLIGREHELVDLTSEMSRWRLITLTGFGGVGKTRLATAAAARVSDTFRDGAWFCDLSFARRAEEVIDVVAEALGIGIDVPRRLMHSVVDTLRDAQLLLLLDNCEHVGSSVCELVSAVLALCPRVRILCTSRAPIGLAAERLIPLHPLGTAASPNEACEAARYLAARARQFGAELVGDDASLNEIARSLDGIPLALELAARRLTAMSPRELTDRLAGKVDVLGDWSTRTPRQRSLAANISWSYELLTADERALFATLATFCGGCSLEAAETLAPAAGIRPSAAASVVASLTAQSMLARTKYAGDSSRYRMLETMRQFALTVLSPSAGSRANRLHAKYFAELAERAFIGSRGAEEPRWAATISTDFANVREAYYFSVASGDMATARRILLAMTDQLVLRERLDVGRWAEYAVQRADGPSELRCTGLGILALAKMMEGDYGDASALATQALADEQKCGALPEWPARNVLGLLSAASFRDRATLLFSEMDTIALHTDDPMPRAVALFDRVLLSTFDRSDEGLRDADELMKLGRSTGSPSIIAMGLISQGRALAQGSPRQALELLREAAQLAQESASTLLARQAERAAAEITANLGDPGSGLDAMANLFNQFVRSGDVSQQVQTLFGMLTSLVAMREFELAATVCGALADTPLGPTNALIDVEATVRSQLDEESFSAALRAGSALELQEVAKVISTGLAQLASRP